MVDPLSDQEDDWCIARLTKEKLGPMPVSIE